MTWKKNSRFLLFFVSRRPYFFIFTKMWPLIRSLDFHLREQTTFCLYNFFFKKKIVPRISSFDFHFRGRTTFCDIILLLKKRYYQKFSIADDLLASHLKKRPLIFFLQTTFLASNFWSRWHQNLIFPSHFLFLFVICHFFWKRKKKHRALRVVRRCSSLAYAKCSTSIPADSIDRLVAAWLTAAGCWKKKNEKWRKNDESNVTHQMELWRVVELP